MNIVPPPSLPHPPSPTPRPQGDSATYICPLNCHSLVLTSKTLAPLPHGAPYPHYRSHGLYTTVFSPPHLCFPYEWLILMGWGGGLGEKGSPPSYLWWRNRHAILCSSAEGQGLTTVTGIPDVPPTHSLSLFPGNSFPPRPLFPIGAFPWWWWIHVALHSGAHTDLIMWQFAPEGNNK